MEETKDDNWESHVAVKQWKTVSLRTRFGTVGNIVMDRYFDPGWSLALWKRGFEIGLIAPHSAQNDLFSLIGELNLHDEAFFLRNN